MNSVAIIRTGSANLASVIAAFRRLHVTARVIETPADLGAHEALVLPGVGAFGAARAQLQADGWDEVLRQRFRDAHPTLAICLGLQLLCEQSEETDKCSGLGILPGTVRRFPASVKVPHFGWNQLRPLALAYFEEGYVYYAHSYRLCDVPTGWDVALTEYAGPFVAAVRRGPLLACQFHPELSGELGHRLLQRWWQSATKFTSAESPSSC